MDNFENLEDVEVIYSDGEDNSDEIIDDGPIDKDQIEDEIIDMSILTFAKHSKSVFSSAISNDQKLAITGGEDDMAYVWDTSTGGIVLECTGHKDSVTEVGFNHNNQYVVTGDMSGLIQVWSVKENKLTWCFEGDDMEWLMWHPQANVLICGCQSGDIYIWQIPSGNCKVLPSPSNVPCTCGKILPNGKQLVAGYRNGQIRLWDIKETTSLWINTDNSSLNTLDINLDGSLLITSPEAQIIKISDGKTIGKVLLEGETEIEGALFDNDLDVVTTGALSGQLCVWQLGKFSLRHQAKIECSVTLLRKGSGSKVLIGATDGAIYVCDIKSCVLKEVLTGHRTDILSITLFPDEKKILTASDDGTAKIFELKN